MPQFVPLTVTTEQQRADLNLILLLALPKCSTVIQLQHYDSTLESDAFSCYNVHNTYNGSGRQQNVAIECDDISMLVAWLAVLPWRVNDVTNPCSLGVWDGTVLHQEIWGNYRHVHLW